jgi:SNF2 family DNA or RNA helicase
LTGTPIHNSLDDYGALLQFLDVPQIKDKSTFDSWIAIPFQNGRTNSLRRLTELIRATCLRRTKRTLRDSCELPDRIERTETLEFSETDQVLYAFFKEKCAQLAENVSTTKLASPEVSQRKEGNLLSLINFLRLICDHGEQLLPRSALDAWRARDDTSISWQMMRSCRKRCYICKTDIEEAALLASKDYEPSHQHWVCAICALQSDGTSGEKDPCPKPALSPCLGDDSSFLGPADSCPPSSAKIKALLRNLRTEQDAGTSPGPSKLAKRYVKLILFKRYRSA